jgi:molybdate transport system ATP-binding protein
VRKNNPTAGPFITLDRVTIRVRDQRLFTGSCWTIDNGQHWAVIGPNGAGKTSLVRAIAGLVPVVDGNIYFHNPTMVPQDIGYLSFETHRNLISREESRDESRSFSGDFKNHLSVRALLRGRAKNKTLPPENRQKWQAKLDLAELLDRPVRGLSTGEVRRVLIAMEVLNSPRMLILDEPFDGLDAQRRERLVSILNRLMDGATQIILVTHRLAEIPPRMTHVLGVKNGRMVFQGERRKLNSLKLMQIYDPGNHPDKPYQGQMTLNRHDRTNSEPVVIDMRNVTVNYGNVTVIRNLNWTVRAGENWAILGPNGSGKTSLLSLIAGDNPQAYANTISIFGRRRGSGETIWDIKQHIGLVSSEFQIRYRKQLLAADVVLSGFFDSVGLYRRASSSQRRIAAAWMKRLGCTALAERSFQLLSQGEQRLVLLVRAMVKSPRLLILDEPCQGLDRVARRRLLSLLNQVGFDSGMQLLFVTHQPEEMLTCITHILRFEKMPSGVYRAHSEMAPARGEN